MKKNTKISATPAQLSAAFTEWLRRWTEDDKTTAEHIRALQNSKPRTYGEQVTPYFISLLEAGKKAQS